MPWTAPTYTLYDSTTTLNRSESAGAERVSLTSWTSLGEGITIGVELDDGSTHWTTIALGYLTAQDGEFIETLGGEKIQLTGEIVLGHPLPSAAAAGNTVYLDTSWSLTSYVLTTTWTEVTY